MLIRKEEDYARQTQEYYIELPQDYFSSRLTTGTHLPILGTITSWRDVSLPKSDSNVSPEKFANVL